MKNFTVVCLPEASDALAQLWTESHNPSVIAAASDQADAVLAEDPFGNSIHLSENLWRYEAGPLRFYYHIRFDDRIVEITDVIRAT